MDEHEGYPSPNETNTALPGIPSEVFFERLKPQDKQSIDELITSVRLQMESDEKHGSIVVVGGALTKEGERKDIDLLLGFNEAVDEKALAYFMRHDYASKDFRDKFAPFVRNMLANNPNFRIVEEYEPDRDPEIESYVRMYGKIVVEDTRTGRIIEIIQQSQKGDVNTIYKDDTQSLSVLAEI